MQPQKSEDNQYGIEKLVVWKKAKDLAVFVYTQILPAFPDDEKFGLTSQLKRSISSVPANIAEGHGRFYYQDTIRFCLNARGSLVESKSHLILAHDIGFLDDAKLEEVNMKIQEVHILINGYILYLKKTKRDHSQEGIKNK